MSKPKVEQMKKDLLKDEECWLVLKSGSEFEYLEYVDDNGGEYGPYGAIMHYTDLHLNGEVWEELIDSEDELFYVWAKYILYSAMLVHPNSMSEELLEKLHSI